MYVYIYLYIYIYYKYAALRCYCTAQKFPPGSVGRPGRVGRLVTDEVVGRAVTNNSSSGIGAPSSSSAITSKLGGGNITLEIPWMTPLEAMISG